MNGDYHATPFSDQNRHRRPFAGLFARVDTGAPNLDTLVADRDCICLIRLRANASPEAIATLGDSLRAYRCSSERALQGLLVDVRSSPVLSVVRLSGFLDTLSALDMSIAVLFDSEIRYQLARVLYGTLANKRRVAFFTALDDAYRHLARDISPR